MILDSDICLQSFLMVIKNMEEEIGQIDAQRIIRKAGHQASKELLDFLPLHLSEGEGIERAGPILEELGFISHMVVLSEDQVEVEGNVILEQLQSQGSASTVGRYFVIGLLEGILQQLSTTQTNVIEAQIINNREIWSFG